MLRPGASAGDRELCPRQHRQLAGSSRRFPTWWKFTRPTSTRFEQDEPIAMLVPQQRGDLESYTVYTLPISAQPHLDADFRRWSTSRTHFLEHHCVRGAWQKDYMLGRGAPAGQHQRRRQLATSTKAPTPQVDEQQNQLP